MLLLLIGTYYISEIGSVSVNLHPFPNSLSQNTVPPCLSIIAFTMDNPNPLPDGAPGVRALDTV